MSLEQNCLYSPTPAIIGRGSFGAIYVILGTCIAYKQVLHDGDEHKDDLLKEYLALEYMRLDFNTDSFFAIPRAYAFSDPSSPSNFRPQDVAFSLARRRNKRPLIRPIITPELFAPFPRATFAMDRIQALPSPAADVLRKAFFPPASNSAGPTLCRLYLGKTYPTTPGRFFSSVNFPLDAARYTHLRESVPKIELPELTEVAWGMGESLGRLHFLGGYDARDVEFVLGGDGFSGLSFYLIDFNQMRRWDLTVVSIPTLVQAFFTNDPYYPRPRSQDPLYEQFKSGYMQEFPTDHQHLADAFLEAIETTQAERDSSSSS
ncbi:hypothetical protein QCA50_004234 [Cerrena zonata]|uniref:DUF3669 domain-containing protein n=1 Tax=Cerrena zonata TaxID=2478898 RepID=A0AAW0GIW0_9APHY